MLGMDVHSSFSLLTYLRFLFINYFDDSWKLLFVIESRENSEAITQITNCTIFCVGELEARQKIYLIFTRKIWRLKIIIKK